ncbi:MAG: type I restriction enzyme, S subunit [Parcubacteria group bacterium Athens1014_26]|nr:MAG: type I restriction enzyme, S subunit [Parcubacteria group bacterium Athens1014_26]
MISLSIIQKSQLEGALRLDAEYYQPEYLLNYLKLEKFGFQILQDLSISNITKGETPLWRGDSYLDAGIPFLRSENLIFAGTDLSNIVFVSKKVHERMKRSKILPNDVLLAIVGATIGHTGLVGNEYLEYNSNQAIAIVRPENEKYSCYLSIVLETKFCQLQIERLKGGGSRDNLDLHEVRVLKIPKPNSRILNYCLEQINKIANDVIYIPKTIDMLSPILSIVPLQLFAYYFAIQKGYNVDRPRNLAKSVTVE